MLCLKKVKFFAARQRNVAEPNPDRLADVQNGIQSGLRVHARGQRRVLAVQLAGELSGIHEELDDTQLPKTDETTDTMEFFSNVDRNLQRTRKTAEVVEDSLQIGLGHSKLTRIAMTGAQLNSGVALVIAAHNLLISADKLEKANASVSSIRDIAAEHFHDFYRAIGVFIAEAILFSTPINYRIAWKGTRFLNNKFLYALRHNGFSGSVDLLLKGLHRLILSEIHYAIRGILPSALRNPEGFVSYLTNLATQTLALVQEFSDVSITNIPAKAEEIVNEYRVFAENTYNVATANVDIGQVIQNVGAQFSGGIDLFSAPYDPGASRL